MLLFSFATDDSEARDRLATSDSVFDPSRSVMLEVSAGRTEEALRWIEESLYDAGPTNRHLPKLVPGQAIAIRVEGSPQQLAGLIQSVRSWSRDANQPGQNPEPSISTMLAVESETPTASDGYVAGAADPNRTMSQTQSQTMGEASSARMMKSSSADEIGELLNRSTLQLGVEVPNAVDAGEVWILIRPQG
jgi:hypothetical protein